MHENAGLISSFLNCLPCPDPESSRMKETVRSNASITRSLFMSSLLGGRSFIHLLKSEVI